MSYDLHLCDPETGKPVQVKERHFVVGGTYAIGGTNELWLSVTYNYAPHFHKVLGENGIRSIYGMTGRESIPVLEAAADQLGRDETDDYWEPTEGNARAALLNLVRLAKMAPDGVWNGD